MKSDRCIWIIEDDPGCQFVYQDILGIRYDIKIFATLAQFESNTDETPLLIIADIRLPDGSFLTKLEAYKQTHSETPIVVVSSLDDIDALRYSFKHGAVDFLTKPFGRSELTVKVERLLGATHTLSDNSFKIDPTSLTVTNINKTCEPLTPKEFQIVNVLHGNKCCLDRDEIIEKVWGNVQVTRKTLDVHLFNLRKKLEPIALAISFEQPNSYRLSDNRVES